MEWYLKAAFHDRRFRVAGGAAAVSIVALASSFLVQAPWATQLALYVLLPALVLSVAAMFAVFGLIVRQDYRERGGAAAAAICRTSRDRSPSP